MPTTPRPPAAYTAIRYRLENTEVTAAIQDRAWADDLHRLYPEYAAGLIQALPPDNADLILEGTPGQYVVRSRGGRQQTYPDRLDAIDDFEFRLTVKMLEGGRHWVHVHAAGLAAQGRAALVLGRSGAGKSSLATCWSVAGLPVLGDDVVMVDTGGTLRPFCRLFKTSLELLAERAIDAAIFPFADSGRDEAWFDPAVFGGWGDAASPAAIVLARFRAGAGLQARRVSKAEGLNALLHSILPTGAQPPAAVTPLAALSAVVDVWELTFSDATEAAASVARRLMV